MSTKEIARTVRLALKQELPEWKFSVRTELYAGGSAIYVSLMSGPKEVILGEQYGQLNHYTLLNPTLVGIDGYKNNGHVLTTEGWEVMVKVTEILSREHWDESDSQSDYFHCAFYRHIEIGRWNRNYKVSA